MISKPQTPPLPPMPPPPANPPMFGGDPATRQAGAQVNPRAGFGGTILGQTNPANTGQKTLLGQ